MKVTADNSEGTTCHDDWHEYVRERFLFDFWHSEDALSLLAGIWPVDAQISNSSAMSSRYGTIEPPVIIHAGLLDQECNVQFRDDYQRLLIRAGRRLRLARELWASGHHMEERFPPAYFIHWSESKNFRPCWLNIWQQHLELVKHKTDASAEKPSEATPILATAAMHGTQMKESEQGESDSIKNQLWALADARANAIRKDRDVSLNEVCTDICRDVISKANKNLMHGQKGWHKLSWLKQKGHLLGWKDPASRK